MLYELYKKSVLLWVILFISCMTTQTAVRRLKDYHFSCARVLPVTVINNQRYYIVGHEKSSWLYGRNGLLNVH